jgi:hypothetical protein
MSDESSLYIINTNYNAGRQAYEVTIGYMVKDEEVKGRYMTVTVVVNVANHKGEEATVKEIAIDKARKILEEAAKAGVE